MHIRHKWDEHGTEETRTDDGGHQLTYYYRKCRRCTVCGKHQTWSSYEKEWW